jgi:hypothetical protein
MGVVYDSDGVWPSAGGTKGSGGPDRRGRDAPGSNGRGRAGDRGAEWPEPIPLGPNHELPAFHVHLLAAWLREWVVAEAEATQTPPHLAAMLGRCALSMCCARRLQVRVHGDWFQPVNLYAIIVLPPANRKSAVFRDAMAPLDAFVCERIQQLGPSRRSPPTTCGGPMRPTWLGPVSIRCSSRSSWAPASKCSRPCTRGSRSAAVTCTRVARGVPALRTTGAVPQKPRKKA